jgi:hypothetical protein
MVEMLDIPLDVPSTALSTASLVSHSISVETQVSKVGLLTPVSSTNVSSCKHVGEDLMQFAAHAGKLAKLPKLQADKLTQFAKVTVLAPPF